MKSLQNLENKMKKCFPYLLSYLTKIITLLMPTYNGVTRIQIESYFKQYPKKADSNGKCKLPKDFPNQKSKQPKSKLLIYWILSLQNGQTRIVSLIKKPIQKRGRQKISSKAKTTQPAPEI